MNLKNSIIFIVLTSLLVSCGSDDKFINKSNERTYFEHGNELWKSDGTNSGTKNITQGNIGSPITKVTSIDESIYFRANDNQLWKSDGTTEGIKLVKKFTNSKYVFGIHKVNDLLIFSTRDVTDNYSLWISDSTKEGTKVIKTFDNAWFFDLTVLNNVLYFLPQDANNEQRNGLWKSDGTEEGTELVKQFEYKDADYLYAINGSLYFTATSTKGGEALWKSDGTPEGTVVFKDVRNNAKETSPDKFINANGTIYFTMEDEALCHAVDESYQDYCGEELWKSDGTKENTEMIKDFGKHFSEKDLNIEPIATVNNTMYFEVGDVTKGWEEGYKSLGLWKSAGREESTILIKDNVDLDDLMNNSKTITLNDTFFFIQGSELWKNDSDNVSAVLVIDFQSSEVKFLGKVNNMVLVEVGGDIWKSDGSEFGTVKIKT